MLFYLRQQRHKLLVIHLCGSGVPLHGAATGAKQLFAKRCGCWRGFIQCLLEAMQGEAQIAPRLIVWLIRPKQGG